MLYTQWNGEAGVWVIDNRANGNGWVYWSCALEVGEHTADFMESFRLIRQTNGEADYVIHVHMNAFSADNSRDLPEDRPPGVWGVINIRNPAGTVIVPAICDYIITNANGDYVYVLGNGFEVVCRDGDGRFNDPIVVFGSYRQSFIGDGEFAPVVNANSGRRPNSDFANEELTWLLLYVDRASGSALMITEHMIDNIQFNRDADATGNAYATSNLRSWLNSEGGTCRGSAFEDNQSDGFLNTAFTAAQLALIIPTTTTADDDGPIPVIYSRVPYEHRPLNWSPTNEVVPVVPTNISAIVSNDLVFALSNSEIWRYMRGPSGRPAGARITDYAAEKGAFVGGNGNGAWWSRSAGDTAENVSMLHSDGGQNTVVPAWLRDRGARPALRVNIGS